MIEAVLRVRLTGAETAAQVHAALEGEGLEVTMSQVKKASSKATKRLGEQPAPAVIEPAKPSAAKEAKLAKQAASQEKAKNAELKSAENAMMEAHRKLRGLKSGDPSAPITVEGTAESFAQQVTKRAITGVLEPGDTDFLKERIEADIATLEWIKLASAAGALTLTEDVVALGGELQLERLKDVRGAKDLAAARACFVVETGSGDNGGYERLDRMMARSGAGEETGNKMDDMD